jgi:hypothetical protein
MTRRRVVDDTGENSSLDKHWHVSRGIPVAFIVSMLIYAIAQTATAAWFASAMSQRVDTIEKAQLQMSQQVSPQGERLTRVEEKLEGVKAGIGDIKTLLTAQDLRDRNNTGKGR